MKYPSLILVLCLSIFSCIFANKSKEKDINFDEFSKIIIQEGGRLKPLDSFARHSLLSFYGKEKCIF